MKTTIIYDGRCKFCSTHIRRIQKKDTKKQFKIISSSSSNLKKYNVTEEQARTGIIFIDERNEVFHKAAAVQQIYSRISKGSFLSWGRNILVLKQLIDLGYWFIARYRYNIYGKCDEECKI